MKRWFPANMLISKRSPKPFIRGAWRSWLALGMLLAISACDSPPRHRVENASPHAASARRLAPEFQTFLPLRRSGEVAGRTLRVMPLEASLAALAPRAMATAQAQADGNVALTVAWVRSEPDSSAARSALSELGFQAAAREHAPQGSYRRRVRPEDRAVFLKHLMKVREELGRAAAAWRERLEQARQAGRLFVEGSRLQAKAGPERPGRLVYTGHPLDLAMPDAGVGAHFFLPVILPEAYPRLKLEAGALAYVRGGRLYVGAHGYLRLETGIVAAGLAPLPERTESVSIGKDGQVRALLDDGAARKIGRLLVVRLEAPQGDGLVFRGPRKWSGAKKFKPGGQGVPALRVGHLEFPPLDVAAASAGLRERLRAGRLLDRLALAFAGALRAKVGGTPSVPHGSPPRAGARQVVIAAGLPFAKPHLKALGVSAEFTPGRTTFTVGDQAGDRGRIVAALTKVLRGLRRRMALAQQNHDNAKRLRDEQGKLKPYRRKMVEIGKEGEVLEAEDPSAFPKELKPDDKDAGPDGFVVYPNVNRQVELADFKRATEEYQLIRKALARLAPNTIFPDPPAWRWKKNHP